MKPTAQAFQPILVVEDNDIDFMAIQRGFRSNRLANPLVHVAEAESALDYLNQRAAYSGDEYLGRPGIILLDLNLPGKLGVELLEELKADTKFRSIPVIVLTTADDARIVEQCYSLGASSFVRKPVDVGGFLQALQLMSDYWFSVAVIPQGQSE